MVLELFSDGLCEPVNPGGTAIWAFVARRGGEVVHRASGVLGSGRAMSSNFAESYAALSALRWAVEAAPGEPVVLRSDSEFVVKAALGGARAGEVETGVVVEALERLFRPLHEIGVARIVWIPRTLNHEPDKLTWDLYLEVDGRKPRYGPRAG